MPDSGHSIRAPIRRVSDTPQVDPARNAKLSRAAKPKSTEPRDPEMEEKILSWISNVAHMKPTTDYEHFIQDGSVLSKVMTSIVFNSVPKEDIDCQWGAKPALDRVKELIREIKRYGIKDCFEPEDLLERRNIPRVTHVLEKLANMAAHDKDSILNFKIEI